MVINFGWKNDSYNQFLQLMNPYNQLFLVVRIVSETMLALSLFPSMEEIFFVWNVTEHKLLTEHELWDIKYDIGKKIK